MFIFLLFHVIVLSDKLGQVTHCKPSSHDPIPSAILLAGVSKGGLCFFDTCRLPREVWFWMPLSSCATSRRILLVPQLHPRHGHLEGNLAETPKQQSVSWMAVDTKTNQNLTMD